MNQIIDFLRCVPDTIWAALIASLLTFGGVVLANRNSRKTVAMNLQHDREQRDKERLMRLRQEVYLPGAEAINAAYSSVGTLVNPNVPDSEVAEKFSKANTYLSKISLIGSTQTHRAASKLNNVLHQHLMKIMGERLPIMALHAKINNCKELINRSSNEKDRFIAIMKEINLRGPSDPGQMDRLQQLFNTEQAHFDKHIVSGVLILVFSWRFKNDAFCSFVSSSNILN